MDWKQIETKWAAMAQRCRADVNCRKVEYDVVVLRRADKTEEAMNVGIKQIATAGIEAPQKCDPVSTH